jgi:hypothetical protein
MNLNVYQKHSQLSTVMLSACTLAGTRPSHIQSPDILVDIGKSTISIQFEHK